MLGEAQGHFKPWMFGVASNASRKRKKKKGLKQKILFTWNTAVAPEVPGHTCALALTPFPPAESTGNGSQCLSSPRTTVRTT